MEEFLGGEEGWRREGAVSRVGKSRSYIHEVDILALWVGSY